MNELVSSAAFRIDAACTAILALNLLVLGGMVNSARGKYKAPANPEDARSTAVPQVLPPEVERMRRVHANAVENVPLMMAVGMMYVLAGAPAIAVAVLMGIVTVFRVLHSVFYIRAMQPARSIAYVVSGVATLVMMGHTVALLF